MIYQIGSYKNKLGSVSTFVLNDSIIGISLFAPSSTGLEAQRDSIMIPHRASRVSTPRRQITIRVDRHG